MTDDTPPMNPNDPHLAGLHPSDDMLFDYVERATGPAVSARIEEHLAICAECRSAVEAGLVLSVQAPHRTIDGPFEQMPLDAQTRMQQALDVEFTRYAQRRAHEQRLAPGRVSSWWQRIGTRGWVAAAGTGLAVAAAIFFATGTHGTSTSSSKSSTIAAQDAPATTAGLESSADTAAPAAAETGAKATAAGAAGGADAAANASVSTSASTSTSSIQASPFPSTDSTGATIAWGAAGSAASSAVANLVVPARMPCVAVLDTDGSSVLVATRLAQAPQTTGRYLPLIPGIAVICRNDATDGSGTSTTVTPAPKSPFTLEPTTQPGGAGATQPAE